MELSAGHAGICNGASGFSSQETWLNVAETSGEDSEH